LEGKGYKKKVQGCAQRGFRRWESGHDHTKKIIGGGRRIYRDRS